MWETGEAYRICEICLEKEVKTIDKIEIDIEENENYGIAEFTVVDAVSLLPLSDATIHIESETDGECIISTDSEGKANQILPIGKNNLSVYKEGYLIRNITININNTIQSIPKIGLSESPMVEGRLSVNEMTYEEIVKAGIDVDAPGNNHVYKYETEIELSASIDWLSVMSYVNADGDFLGFDICTPEDEPDDDEPNDDEENEPGSSDDNDVIYYHHSSKPKQVGDGIPVTLQSGEEVTIFPVNEKFFLIIYGEVKWLKEMFDVELLVLNHSNTDTIEDCVAEISLPDGLSLAPMSRGGQSLTQHIDHIAERKSKSVHWYLRGDKEGVYNINASLKGKTMPFEEEFAYEYVAKDPIKVYAGSALHMTFEMPDSAFYKDDYTVKITLENVSDKTLYGVSHLVKGFKQGKITYYSDGSQKEEEYLSEMLSESEKVQEFKPGDKIVIEVTTNILFQSEIIKNQMEEMIGKVDGLETLYNGYSAMVKCVEMFDTFGSMISNVSKNIDNVITSGVFDADKASATTTTTTTTTSTTTSTTTTTTTSTTTSMTTTTAKTTTTSTTTSTTTTITTSTTTTTTTTTITSTTTTVTSTTTSMTTTTPPTTTEPAYLLGDVNEDGSVDSSDASRVLAEYAKIQTGGAGEFTDVQYKAADVNKDDTVDSSDASKILAYYAMVSTGKKPTWD